MNAGDYLAAYTLMGVFYSLPKVVGFLNFLNKDPDWYEDIPGPAWVISFVAGLIVTGVMLAVTVTWPYWLAKNFFSKGE
jgi:hypothetical protein